MKRATSIKIEPDTDFSSYFQAANQNSKIIQNQLIKSFYTSLLSINSLSGGIGNTDSHDSINLNLNSFQSNIITTSDEFCSIERFYAALLFVDISGFTAASMNCEVNNYFNMINDYFEKVIGVINSYKGDIIRFAGDALFVIWPIDLSELPGLESYTSESIKSHPNFINAAKSVVNIAYQCSLKIIAECSNYHIEKRPESILSPGGKFNITSPLNKGPPPSNKFFGINRFINMFSSGSKISPMKEEESEKSTKFTFDDKDVKDSNNRMNNKKSHSPKNSNNQIGYNILDVHQSVGFGLLGSANIGYQDRWEYFLLGEPLKHTAKGIKFANNGELVLTNTCHDFIHPPDCTCTSFENKNYFRVQLKKDNTKKFSKTSNILAAKLDKINDNKYVTIERELLKKHINVINSYFCYLKDLFKVQFKQFIAFNKEHVSSINSKILDDILYTCQKFSFDDTEPSDADNEKYYSLWIDNCAKNWFQNTLHQYLIYELGKHTHELLRSSTLKNPTDFSLSFLDYLNEYFLPSRSKLDRMASSSNMNVGDNLEHQFSLTLKKNHSIIFKSLNKLDETDFKSEISTPSIIFIHIHNLNTDIKEFDDETFQHSFYSCNLNNINDSQNNEYNTTLNSISYSFNFLQKTKSEHEDDLFLLNNLQKCISTILRCITPLNGHLRQFMSDDKGTICICTFGLKGNANDNSSSSIQAARNIILGLYQIGLESSIGISTGPTYCGLLGSHFRNEFGLLSSSVNLSARLMTNAHPFFVYSDGDTIRNNGNYGYSLVTTIKAKGFNYDVDVYSPLYPVEQVPKEIAEAWSLPKSKKTYHTDKSMHQHSLLINSCFSINSDTTTNFANIDDAHYIARPDETNECIEFLFNDINLALNEINNENIITYLEKKIECFPKIIFIIGIQGIGKYTFLCSIIKHIKLATEPLKLENLNSYVISSRNFSCSNIDPFHQWKSIIKKILMLIGKGSSISSSEDSDKKLLSFKYIDAGIKAISEISSPFFKKWMFLLVNYDFLPREVSVDSELSSPSPINYTSNSSLTNSNHSKYLINLTSVLYELIKNALYLTKSIFFFVFPKLELFDSWSFKLLSKLLKENLRIRIIGSTVSPVESFKFIPKSIIKSNIFSLELKAFTNPNDIFKLVQFNLDRPIKVDDSFKKTLLEETKGIPLYAVELALNLNVYKKENPKASHLELLDLAVSSPTYKINKSVSFEISIFDDFTQGVLKTASIIASNGKSFNIFVINKALDEEINHDDEAKIYESIKKIFTRGLIVVENTSDENNSDDNNSSLVNSSSLLKSPEFKNNNFIFRSELERISIQGMLTLRNQQKIHKNIAIHFRKKNFYSGPILDDILEEAFHWEHSRIFSYSTLCYYKAAKLLQNKGDLNQYRHYLETAYNSLIALKTEVKVGNFELNFHNIIPYLSFNIPVQCWKKEEFHLATQGFQENEEIYYMILLELLINNLNSWSFLPSIQLADETLIYFIETNHEENELTNHDSDYSNSNTPTASPRPKILGSTKVTKNGKPIFMRAFSLAGLRIRRSMEENILKSAFIKNSKDFFQSNFNQFLCIYCFSYIFQRKLPSFEIIKVKSVSKFYYERTLHNSTPNDKLHEINSVAILLLIELFLGNDSKLTTISPPLDLISKNLPKKDSNLVNNETSTSGSNLLLDTTNHPEDKFFNFLIENYDPISYSTRIVTSYNFDIVAYTIIQYGINKVILGNYELGFDCLKRSLKILKEITHTESLNRSILGLFTLSILLDELPSISMVFPHLQKCEEDLSFISLPQNIRIELFGFIRTLNTIVKKDKTNFNTEIKPINSNDSLHNNRKIKVKKTIKKTIKRKKLSIEKIHENSELDTSNQIPKNNVDDEEEVEIEEEIEEEVDIEEEAKSLVFNSFEISGFYQIYEMNKDYFDDEETTINIDSTIGTILLRSGFSRELLSLFVGITFNINTMQIDNLVSIFLKYLFTNIYETFTIIHGPELSPNSPKNKPLTPKLELKDYYTNTQVILLIKVLIILTNFKASIDKTITDSEATTTNTTSESITSGSNSHNDNNNTNLYFDYSIDKIEKIYKDKLIELDNVTPSNTLLSQYLKIILNKSTI